MIYELDKSLMKKIYMYQTYDQFIFTEKGKRSVVAVENKDGNFWIEEFSNKTKALIYLLNNNFMPQHVEEEYLKNKDKYKNYNKVVRHKHEYLLDRNLHDRDFLEFNPTKKYEFEIGMGRSEIPGKFKATIKDALGLASNYESDLAYKGIIIFSPLGFEYEHNRRLIDKFVGKNVKLPYRFINSKEIKWIDEKEKNIKI